MEKWKLPFRFYCSYSTNLNEEAGEVRRIGFMFLHIGSCLVVASAFVSPQLKPIPETRNLCTNAVKTHSTQLHAAFVNSSRTYSLHFLRIPKGWVAVKELKLSYHIGETL